MSKSGSSNAIGYSANGRTYVASPRNGKYRKLVTGNVNNAAPHKKRAIRLTSFISPYERTKNRRCSGREIQLHPSKDTDLKKRFVLRANSLFGSHRLE